MEQESLKSGFHQIECEKTQSLVIRTGCSLDYPDNWQTYGNADDRYILNKRQSQEGSIFVWMMCF